MSTPEPPRDHTVLVIDDDEDFCSSIQELLTARGYAVETFPSGTRALERLRSDDEPTPSAIVVDLRMPGMDGYSFLGACESDPRLKSIPVVVVSAFGDPTGISADFLSKPVNVSRLLRTLQVAMLTGR